MAALAITSMIQRKIVDVDGAMSDILPPTYLEKEVRLWQTEAVQSSLLQEQAVALQLVCRQLRQVWAQRSRDHCRDRALLAHVFCYFKCQHSAGLFKELKQKGKQA